MRSAVPVVTSSVSPGVDTQFVSPVLPEAAIPGYSSEALATPPKDIAAALASVCRAAAEHGIAVVCGAPTAQDGDGEGVGFNSAVVINRRGIVVGAQSKMQLVPTDDGWCKAGVRLQIFELWGVPLAIIICHDKRYPELARLPVLAGARVIIYISAETWHDDLPLPAPREPAWSAARLAAEVGVYRAQAQARAVENRVWLVKSNVAGCADAPSLGSHGGSCVIDPTGMVVCEASMFQEELVVATLDLAMATALYANKSLLPTYAFSDWWRDGLTRANIQRIKL